MLIRVTAILVSVLWVFLSSWTGRVHMSWAQDSEKVKSSTHIDTKGDGHHPSLPDDNLQNTQIDSTKLKLTELNFEFSLTIYPQHELIELEPSETIAQYWSDLYTPASAYLSPQDGSQASDNFVAWRRSQLLFSQLKDLEALQLSHAEILFDFDDENLDLETLRPTPLKRAQEMLTHLQAQAKLLEGNLWLKQEEKLQSQLNILVKLAESEEQLKRTLERLSKLLQSKIVQSIPADGEPVKPDPQSRRLMTKLMVFASSVQQRYDLLTHSVESIEALIQDSVKLRVQLPQLQINQQTKVDQLTHWIGYLSVRERIKRNYQEESLERLMSQQSLFSRMIEERWQGIREERLSLESALEELYENHTTAIQQLVGIAT